MVYLAGDLSYYFVKSSTGDDVFNYQRVGRIRD